MWQCQGLGHLVLKPAFRCFSLAGMKKVHNPEELNLSLFCDVIYNLTKHPEDKRSWTLDDSCAKQSHRSPMLVNIQDRLHPPVSKPLQPPTGKKKTLLGGPDVAPTATGDLSDEVFQLQGVSLANFSVNPLKKGRHTVWIRVGSC